MRDRSFIVHCSLRLASSPETDLSVVMARDEHTGEVRAEKQINGIIDVSAFFCDEDPDSDTAPSHPSSWLYYPSQMPTDNSRSRNLPATFFCFPDVSICRAGKYRLEFQLARVSRSPSTTCKYLPHQHTLAVQNTLPLCTALRVPHRHGKPFHPNHWIHKHSLGSVALRYQNDI